MKGIKRRESVGDLHRRLRAQAFFGPYSAKEIVMVAETFASIVVKLQNTGKNYKDLEALAESHERTRQAMESKVPLHKFFQEPEMLARPHYMKSFQKLSVSKGHKDQGRVDLRTVFSTVFPYMKRIEVDEAMEYVLMEEKEIPVEYLMTGEEEEEEMVDPFEEDRAADRLKQLAELFALYDIDGNGVVDVSEIKEALRENQGLYQTRKRLGSVVEDNEGDTDDIMQIVQNINKGQSKELDFDAFVELFKDIF